MQRPQACRPTQKLPTPQHACPQGAEQNLDVAERRGDNGNSISECALTLSTPLGYTREVSGATRMTRASDSNRPHAPEMRDCFAHGNR